MRKTLLCLSFALSVMLSVLALLQVSVASTPTVLYNFCSQPNCTDGANPEADLAIDLSGNLWGTTTNGGAHGFGTIFELTKSSGFTIIGQIYSFQGGPGDGAFPVAGLVFDAQTGLFYGTTSEGGTGSCTGGCGTMFAFLPGSGSDTILHFFGASGDGSTPRAELLLDSSQNFYGTTSAGGSTNCAGGCGTVFLMNPITNTYTLLHRFTGVADGTDPVAGLVFDSQGNLWGTAQKGGTNNFGTIFELAAPSFTNLAFVHSFSGPPNGAYPVAALTFDVSVGGALGTLYGTTSAGGSSVCPGGCGSVFELEISGHVIKTIYKLTGVGSNRSGSAPIGKLALDNIAGDPRLGHLYGTASMGGINTGACPATGCGTLFEICPPTRACTYRESTLLNFDGTDGQNPLAGLLLDFTFLGDSPLGGKGACPSSCVGTAKAGGSNGAGTVLGITP